MTRQFTNISCAQDATSKPVLLFPKSLLSGLIVSSPKLTFQLSGLELRGSYTDLTSRPVTGPTPTVAPAVGGLLYIAGTPPPSGGAVSMRVTIANCVITQGAAQFRGGLIYANSAWVTVTSTTLSHGMAGMGGALHASHTTISFIDVTMTNNTATRDGGGVSLDNTASLDARSSAGISFSFNRAQYLGGAVFGADVTVVTLTAQDMHDNAADLGGAVAVAGEVTVTASQSTFSRNRALTHGGAVYALKGGRGSYSDVNITQCIFKLNAAGGNGGALAADRTGVRVVNSTFDKNSAARRGGAVWSFSPAFSGAVRSGEVTPVPLPVLTRR